MPAVKSLIPKNDAAEQAVIGSLLMGASPYAAPIRAEHFAAPDHRLVFGAVMALADEGQPVNVTSVTSHLTAKGQLEDAGGPPARFLSADVASGGESTVQHYFPDLEAARRNREAVLHIHKHLDDLTSLRVDAVTFAEELAQLSAPAAVSSGGDSVGEILADIEQEIANGQAAEVFPCNLGPLDQHLEGGFHRGELGVIAANTGGGKTALMLQIAVANAEAGRKVRYFTLELPKKDITKRMACALRGVSMKDSKKFGAAACDLAALPLKVHQQFSELGEIAAEIRAAVRAGDCDLAVVDYCQRVSVKADTRELAVASVAQTLKNIALRENIPVLTASQLNENGALRESRAIGHEADFVLVIGEDDVLVDKFRRGPCNVRLPCHLLGAQSRFVATAKEGGR
jgi:replicative DNA helicase